MIAIGDDGWDEIRATFGPLRAALFILATTMLTLFAILLPTYPAELHSIPLRLNERKVRQLSAAGSPTYRLEIGRDGHMTLDGRPLCFLIDLRQELDVIANGPEPILEVLPDPEVRHDRFVEIIAVTARADIQNLKVELQPRAGRRPTRPASLECRQRLML